MIKPILLEPRFVPSLEDLPAPAAHPFIHHQQSLFDTITALGELGVLEQHIEAEVAVLGCEIDTGAGERLVPIVMRPGPAQSPMPYRLSLLHRGGVLHSLRAGEIDNVQISVVPTLTEGRIVLPSKVDSADPHPMAGTLERLDQQIRLRTCEDAA